MAARRFILTLIVVFGLVSNLVPMPTLARPVLAPDCLNSPNEIVAENCLTGNPPGEWDVSGAGDANIQGYATDISVDQGGTIEFKVDTDATDYRLDVYRLGYYNGDGARFITTLQPNVTLPQNQPACLFDETGDINLVDCGNWGVSASWTVPGNATSGLYIAKLVREDGIAGASHIAFIVRDDDGNSDLLFQTSDTTWQAYNRYGGYSLYDGGTGVNDNAHAHKVSYNRPFTTRGAPTEDWLFNAEYPMIRWLERNGYDVSYFTDVDSDRRGSEILDHKVFMSVGHDEYWSAGQRNAVEAARGQGVNLAFFSGNESYWKTRWENSADGSNTPYRTLVTYKEGDAQGGEHYNCLGNFACDPDPTVWTGLWRQNAPGHDGGRPENSMSGNISWGDATTAIQVPASAGNLRFWRNAGITTDTTLAANTLGYEFDWEQAAYASSYPPGRITLSDTTAVGKTHKMSLYRAYSGALVFGAGTVQWSWGLDGTHDRGTSTSDPRMQQATVNLFADMGVQPGSLQDGLTAATASTDTTPPVSSITSPLNGATVSGLVTIVGTASDTGEGVGAVGAVEVSVDGGTTWHAATGRENWSYSWTPDLGSVNIKSRAVDDSGNIETPSAGITITVGSRTCPCSIFAPSTTGTQDPDSSAVELGVKFRSDLAGYITGIRFYKTINNTGVHTGNLWSTTGTNLATITFSGESATGWQEALFSSPVAIAASTTYVASYYAPVGKYATGTSFASAGVDNPPLHALQNGVDGANGVYLDVNGGGYPTLTFESSNYLVDVVFVTSVGPDTTPPVVNSVTPADNATNVPTSANANAAFNEPLDAATVSASTFELRDATNALVPAAVTYSNAARTVTLDPTAALAYSTLYTAKLIGGTSGIKDVAGNPLAADFTWTFTTAAEPPPPPDTGPGGPILLVTSAGATNPFGRYYAEILRAEGFNAFFATDLANVTPATLADYKVVLLAEMSLSTAQANMFTDWVNGGGHLIAFRPTGTLAANLGLTDAGGTTTDGYIKIETTTALGKGLHAETLQTHGTSSHLTVVAGTMIATLYSDANTATTYPAVAQIGYGAGQLVVFAYDLAQSVVLTRQGNPAWAYQERDGMPDGIRAVDLFAGGGSAPNWIDVSKIQIPQADEQMRLLSHAIEQMSAPTLPLPRLWYFPGLGKSALVITGDSEGCSGSCVDAPMQDANNHGGHYSVYLLGTQPTKAQVDAWMAAGNDVSVHYDDTANASHPTVANMTAVYDNMTQAHINAYGFGPLTVRNHWVLWTGWAEQAQIELSHGIRMDTNYYNYGTWLGTTPGHFTGSGLPMRFADANGQILDIFQSNTQLPDEWWQGNIYSAFQTYLNNSLAGDYAFLDANFHPPSYGNYQAQADQMMTLATSHGVPIWSAGDMLHFLDARNQAQLNSIAWNNAHLTFVVAQPITGQNLTVMLPANAGGANLTSVKVNGSTVAFTLQTVKGYQYALVPVSTGSYDALYAPDTDAPIIPNVAAAPQADNSAIVTWTTDEPATSRVDLGTAPDTLTPGTIDSNLVTAHNVTLTGLAPNTTYYYRVASADAANNTTVSPASGDAPLTFSMPAASLIDTTAADFGAGSGCYIAQTDNGEVILAPTAGTEFSGSTLPSGWSTPIWNTGGTVTVSGGHVTADGAAAQFDTDYTPGHSVEFVATFAPVLYQTAGWSSMSPTIFNTGPWAVFGTRISSSTLYASTWMAGAGGPVDVSIGGAYLGSPHRYRIDWNASNVVFYVDGVEVSNQPVAISGSMRTGYSDATTGGSALVVDWARVAPYGTACTFSSRILSAGGDATWNNLTWTSNIPAGTSLALSYRTGNTATPDGTWSAFTPASGAAINASGRYFQYRADLATTDPNQTPSLADVTVGYNVGADTAPPAISGVTATPHSDGTATVAWTTDEAATSRVDLGTSPDALATGTADPALVTAHSVTLTGLAPSTTYYYRVASADAANNQALIPLPADAPLSFTTPAPRFIDTTVTDFSAGTLGSCRVVAHDGNGELTLAPTMAEDFSGATLPSGWTSMAWNGGGGTVSNGQLVAEAGAGVFTTSFGPGRSMEFVGTFGAGAFQHMGLVASANFDAPWIIFSTNSSSTDLYARINTGGSNDVAVLIPGSWLGAPHRYRIDWGTSTIAFYIDGQQVDTRSGTDATISASLLPVVSDLNPGGAVAQMDWLQVSPFATPCSYDSRIFDAGASANWNNMSWTGTTPAGTALALSYRIGNTATPDSSWTPFMPVAASGAGLGGTARYFQYRAAFSTSDPNRTPVLADVTIDYAPGTDTTPPTITGRFPPSGATGIDFNASVTVTFSEQINGSTLTGSTFRLRASGAGSDVPATLTFNGSTATLTPNTALSALTTYQVTVAGSVADLSGNPLGSDATWSFTTKTATFSLTDTTAADFAAGTLGTCYLAQTGNGEVMLAPATGTEFSGTTLASGWSGTAWSTGGTATVSGGHVAVDGAVAQYNTGFNPGVSLQFSGTFAVATPFQVGGFGSSSTAFNAVPWLGFGTGSTGDQLYARVAAGSTPTDVALGNQYLGTPHLYRVDWNASNVVFWIDGTQVASQSVPVSGPMLAGFSDFNPGGGTLIVDWARVAPYASPCNYDSRIIDAGASANWDTLAWTGTTPAGTSLVLQYRIGNTATPDSSWTPFMSVGTSVATLGGNARYFQYRAVLATSDPNQTPVLADVTLTYTLGSDTTAPTITGRSPAAGATDVDINSSIVVTFSEPMNGATITGSTVRLHGASGDVAATLSFGGNTATLTPNAALANFTNYQVFIAGSAADLSGNPLGADAAWSFTTQAETVSVVDTTQADFTAGTPGTCRIETHDGNGEVTLGATVAEDFSGGPALPPSWYSYINTSGGTVTISGGQLSVDGTFAGLNTTFSSGRSIEFIATFGADTYQHAGLVSDQSFGSFVMFSTNNTNNTMYTRVSGGSNSEIPGNWIGAPHRYRIEWTSNSEAFYIDGVLKNTQNVAIVTALRPMFSDYNKNNTGLSADWLQLSPFTSPCSFVSRSLDAGQNAAWSNLSWTGSVTAGATIGFETRTSTDNINWSSWAAMGGDGSLSNPDGRYVQYRATLAATDDTQTPVLSSVTLKASLRPTNHAPISNAGGPYTADLGSAVALDGTGSSDPDVAYGDTIVTYEWDINSDGTYELTGVAPTITAGQIDALGPGAHTIQLRVTDTHGAVGTAEATLNINAATHTLDLVAGWNLVSFNVMPADTHPAAVLASVAGSYDLVYAWDAATQQWLKYAPSAPAYVNTLDTLDRTLGFWIHMTEAHTLAVTGNVPATTAINLYTGWNLIGYPSVVDRDLPGAMSGIDFSLVYAYHASNSSDPWKLFDRNATYSNDLTELAPGWGYWIQITSPVAWIVAYAGP